MVEKYIFRFQVVVFSIDAVQVLLAVVYIEQAPALWVTHQMDCQSIPINPGK